MVVVKINLFWKPISKSITKLNLIQYSELDDIRLKHISQAKSVKLRSINWLQNELQCTWEGLNNNLISIWLEEPPYERETNVKVWSCKNEPDYKNAACASWLQAIIIIPTSETANFWGNITRDVTASVTESCHPDILIIIIIQSSNLWSLKFRRLRKVEFVLVRIRSGWHQLGPVC